MAEAVEAREPRSGEEEGGLIGPVSRTPFHSGAPASIGVPLFLVGSIALGFLEINYFPTADVGGPLAIILAATGMGMLATMIWSIGLGESIVASIFGIFGGFWISFGVLALGLLHNWYGLNPAAVAPAKVPTAAAVAASGLAVNHVVEAFLISWLAVIVLLTVNTFRLPLAFTAIFVLVDVALACVLIGTIRTSQTWHTVGGIVIFAFVAIGMLLYFDTMSQAFGGKPIPLGKPVQK